MSVRVTGTWNKHSRPFNYWKEIGDRAEISTIQLPISESGERNANIDDVRIIPIARRFSECVLQDVRWSYLTDTKYD